MPTPFTCPSCGRSGRIPDHFSGTHVKCPACQTKTQISSGELELIPFAEEPASPARLPSSDESRPLPRTSREVADEAPREKPAIPVAWIAGGIGAGVFALVVVGGVVGFLLGGRSAPKPEPGHGPVIRPPVSRRPIVATRDRENDDPKTSRFRSRTRPKSSAPDPESPVGPGPSAEAAKDHEPQVGELAAKVEKGGAESGSLGAQAPNLVPVAAKADGTPADAIQRIKDSTVFIKVKVGRASGSGSGFVFQVDGDKVLVATNFHVVNPHLQGPEESAPPQLARLRPEVTVVFRSGRGGQLEQSVPATVIASEFEGNHDLAILKVEKVRNPPSPIALTDNVVPTETMPILIYGFPFGNIDRILESRAQGNPSITINKGSVSSLRMDEFNRLSYVQIDGSLNPGNSGGPVVDEQGRLVGVAVSQISNTTIGFAIPGAELRQMLDGRVGRLSLALRSVVADTAELQVQAKVIDPNSHIKNVELYYTQLSSRRPTLKPNEDGTWAPIPDATKVSLAFNRPIASATFQTKLAPGRRRSFLLQSAYQDDAGHTIYSSPVNYELPNRPNSLAPIGPSGPGQSEEPSAQPPKIELAFSKLGPLVDPSKNCKLEKTETSATIEVPPGVHVLSPELGQYNSPMALKEIRGDFIAHVKVAGTMLPGAEPPKFKKGVLPAATHGAGLVLWQDRSNYIVLERMARSRKGRANLESEVFLEIIKNSKIVGRAHLNTPDTDLLIRLFRIRGGIQGMYSTDGKRWVVLKKFAVPFPDELQVGLLAANASRETLKASFEDFLLLTDPKAMNEAEKN